MTWQSGISDAGVQSLRFCEQLESANLMGSPTGDGAVAALAGKPRLRRLSTGRLTTDAGLRLLREIPLLVTTYTMQYLLNVQRTLGSNSTLEVGYTGNQSRKVNYLVNANAPVPGITPFDARKPYPEWHGIQVPDRCRHRKLQRSMRETDPALRRETHHQGSAIHGPRPWT